MFNVKVPHWNYIVLQKGRGRGRRKNRHMYCRSYGFSFYTTFLIKITTLSIIFQKRGMKGLGYESAEGTCNVAEHIIMIELHHPVAPTRSPPIRSRRSTTYAYEEASRRRRGITRVIAFGQHVRGGGDGHAPGSGTGAGGRGEGGGGGGARRKRKERLTRHEGRREQERGRCQGEKGRNSPCDAKCFVTMMMRAWLF